MLSSLKSNRWRIGVVQMINNLLGFVRTGRHGSEPATVPYDH
jgi:hypothetical protein